MASNRQSLMGDINDQIDEIRSEFYRVLEFEEDDWSEKKELAKRELFYAINELRIKAENL